MIQYGAQYAHRNGAEFRVYTSKSHDAVKNPLPYQTKVTFLRQLFPGLNVVDDPNATTAFAICKKLSDEGYDDVTMITGGDRVAEFKRSIGKYVLPRDNPKFDPKKNYGFKKFDVINSGERKAGISGTDMRKYIKAGKFDKFMSVAPTTNKALARKIFNAAKQNLAEETTHGISRKDFHDKLMSFVDYTCAHLGIDDKPTIKYKEDGKEGHQPSFASYSPGDKVVSILTKNRHPMDVFRSVAHELIHHKQNLDGRLGKNIKREGATGSKIENEANSEAGKIMRYFGADNPSYFDMHYVKEQKAIILSGTPGSGKDKILKEAILTNGFTEISAENFHASEIRGNLVVNGTSDYLKIKTIKEALELQGYETIMVFVNTSNEVSKQRNEARQGKGRVIMENVRFSKWMAAQENLDRYDQLFERIIEVKNDLDLNQSEQVIKETYDKLINSVSKEIEDFALNEADRRFQNMLNEVGGAGNFGTQQLTDRYKYDTPGQEPGKFATMKVLKLKNKDKNVKVYGKIPQVNDRLGQTYTSAKNPSFSGDTSGDNSFMPPEPISVMRWSMSEETKRRFRERYGKLAEQKIKETADRLIRAESLEDPYSSLSGMTPNSSFKDDIDFGGSQKKAADDEATSLFGKRKSLNKKRK
jgi:hypothetical protein